MTTQTKLTNALLLTGALMMTLAAGCAQEISHTESDKPGFFGGRTRTESTTVRNADGTISTESSKQVTR